MNLYSKLLCAPEGGDGGGDGGAGGAGADTGGDGGGEGGDAGAGDTGNVFGGDAGTGGDAGDGGAGDNGDAGDGGDAGTGDDGDAGDTGGEINYDFTGIEIEGVTPEVRDEILGEEGMKGFLDKAKEAGISQDQIGLIGEEYVKNVTEWRNELQNLTNQINPNKTELAKTLSPETKQMIKNGQFQNFLSKTTNDPDILEKVNNSFTTKDQYEIMASIISGAGRKGIGEVGAGAGADKSGMGKPYTKAEYFADLSKHSKMENDGTSKADRNAFMEKILENKRLRGVAEIHK